MVFDDPASRQISCTCTYSTCTLHEPQPQFAHGVSISWNACPSQGEYAVSAITRSWVEPWTAELYLPVEIYMYLPFMYLHVSICGLGC